MKDTFSANFPSQGFIQGTLEPEDLAPIKKEIDNNNQNKLDDCVEHNK